MKKFIAILLTLVMLACFAGCGINKTLVDTVYNYDRAIIQLPNGEVADVKVKTWKDYDGEQIQIVAEDGTVYLTSSYNCVLIRN